MAISLVQQPADLAWARNPCVVQVRCLDDVGQTFSAKGVKSVLSSAAASRFSTAATLTVVFEDTDGGATTVVFTAVATPSTEAHIPDSTFSGSSTAYWDAVAAAVQGHPLIGPFFRCRATGSLGGTSVTIQERTATADWSVEFSNSAGFSVTHTATVAPDSTPANYRARVEVFFEKTWKSGDWSLAASVEGQPDADGYWSTDISSVLDAHCRASQTLPGVPDYGLAEPTRCDNLRRFYIRYAEQFGTPAEVQGWTASTVRRVVNGGVSMGRFADGLTISGVASETGGFLSWMPDGREVGPDAPNYLTFFNTDSAKNIALKMQWRHRDTLALSSSATFFDGSPLAVAAGESATIPINPALFGLEANDDAFEMRLTVIEAGGATELSDTRSFRIDRTFFRSERHLAFINSLGAPEVVRCRGVWAKSVEIDRKFASKVLPVGFTGLAAEETQVWEKATGELTYRTGFVTRGEADVLFEMLTARDLCDVKADGYMPLLLTSKQFSITDSERQLHSFSLECRPKMQMRNFSAAPMPLDPSGNFWELPDGSAWTDQNLISWDLP